MAKREVPGSGPYTCKVLFIGEAPGRQEELKGEPFIGQTGRFVRAALRGGGIDPDTEVRFNNALPVNVEIPGDARARQKLIDQYAGWLDEDLARCKPKVIVACGGVALQRLTGRTDITEEHGAVEPVRTHGASGTVLLSSEASFIPHTTTTPQLLVSTLHPSGAFHTKLQAGKETIGRVITRAARYATGQLEFDPQYPVIRYHLPDNIAIGARQVVIDTEYDSETRSTFMVGVSVDGQTIYSMRKPFKANELATLARLMNDPFLTKVGHFHPAEVKALSWLGIDCRGPWFDTMYGFNVLYPDLDKNLGHVAKFYLDDVANWKGMAHDDPLYNALDVYYTARVREHVADELRQAGMTDLFMREVMPATAVLFGMEERGIQVDLEAAAQNNEALAAERDGLIKEIKAEVDETLFARRRGPVEARIALLELELSQCGATMLGQCPEHPNYNGLVKPRGKNKGECQCAVVYDAVEGERKAIAEWRKERTKLQGQLKRWSEGFEPTNNHHLRWLLYDKEAYGLRAVYKDGALTANATAIAKICARSNVPDTTKSVLKRIKRVQHLDKMIETFGKPPVDEAGVAHPPYSPTTGTGRVKGGDDASNDKVGSEYAFNALNVPVPMRHVFVPGE
jgi:uracil-DNA glycosylase family 4